MNTLGVAWLVVMVGFPMVGDDGNPCGKAIPSSIGSIIFPSRNLHLQRMSQILRICFYGFPTVFHLVQDFLLSVSPAAMSQKHPGFVLNRPTPRSETYGRLEFNVWYGALTFKRVPFLSHPVFHVQQILVELISTDLARLMISARCG